ncbi:peptidoglycan editing factor PgeF [Alishewanella tabrizica]|uniref:Purine nucleoside phosphorylase n=1 Tax=Alishewanella tabrizica TaxID=671278 RepID=A0ABQ2WW89_9ALTE|nr:peptidoglycan editing factor PgeF [Alishewanella tabrizica]GGW71647.1 laccase domain protein [Alishewanella tabrizica]
MPLSRLTENLLVPDWPAPLNVRAVSSTRVGGCSRGVFDSFNLGDHVGDEPQHVQHNRQRFQDLSGMPTAPLWLQQVHGTNVAQPELVTYANTAPIMADAAYSKQPKRVCVVMTADCLPILLCDKAGREVAAIHAGWRGLASGVIEETLKHFQASSETILAWLGPAISKSAFEVGAEVRNTFIQHQAMAEAAFQPTAQGKYLADLYLLAKQRLMAQGVNAIYGGDYCTYQQPAQFFSYRRDGQTGRMASAIWLD